MYEGVIADLRLELERLHITHHDTCTQLEAASLTAYRVSQLEEEVSMYRDTAKATAVDCQRWVYACVCMNVCVNEYVCI